MKSNSKIEVLLHLLCVAYNPQMFYDTRDLELSSKYNAIDKITEELQQAIDEAEREKFGVFIEFLDSLPS